VSIARVCKTPDTVPKNPRENREPSASLSTRANLRGQNKPPSTAKPTIEVGNMTLFPLLMVQCGKQTKAKASDSLNIPRGRKEVDGGEELIRTPRH
jgi:hypothetical protein